MIDYVVGFAFNSEKDDILLVKKERPEWQRGFLNGIGGKIKPGELSSVAMRREALEETGLDLPWQARGIMRGVNKNGVGFTCHIFYAFSNDIYEYRQKEDEELDIILVKELRNFQCVPNVPFLIEFGLSSDNKPYIIVEYGTGL